MVPLALLAASAIFGIDGKLNADEAMRVSEQAQDEYSCAVEKFNQRKKDAEKSLQTLGETKLNIYGTQIRDFVSAFSILKETQLREGSGIKELEKLSFDDKQFEQLKLDTLENDNLLESNPTRDVFFSWGIGGMVGLAFYHSKTKGQKDDAYANLAIVKKRVAEMELVEEQFYIIQKNAEQLQSFFERFSKIMDKANQNLYQIVEQKKEWNLLMSDEKDKVIVALKTVQILKAMIDMPLLGEDGMLTKDICDILSQRENVLKVFGDQTGLAQV